MDDLERLREEYEELVGQTVRIRAYEDMDAEFGRNAHGSIATYFSFTDEMKRFCGKEFRVDRIFVNTKGVPAIILKATDTLSSLTSIENYFISSDMLDFLHSNDPLEEEESLVDFLTQMKVV